MTIGAYGNSFKLALEESGFSVNTTADGERAIALIRAERPAALVLDLTLPRADGFGVAEAMRAQCGDVVPIVVVTVDHGAREKAGAVGAVGHPGKPLDLKELTQLVTRAREGARAGSTVIGASYSGRDASCAGRPSAPMRIAELA